jgi:hypothetical protein
MRIELCLIKSFYSNTIYNKYNKYINTNLLKTNNKDLYKLISCISLYHEKYPDQDIKSTSEFELFFFSQFPASTDKEKESFSPLFQRLEETDVDIRIIDDYINAYRERQDGNRIALLGLDIAEGRKSWSEVSGEIQDVLEASSKNTVKEDIFVSSSLAEIAKRREVNSGLRWPLSSLNKRLGSLRQGDYGFIFARPETGKTTFLSHVATHMASQTDKPILWFNNEQEGHVVQAYCYRAALGLTNPQLYAKIEENEKLYKELTGDRIRIYDSANIYRKDVESIVRSYGAGLIIFDQIDKIKGFNSDRNDLELGAIYQWARELSKEFAPTIGVCQAGESAANKRYLTMEDTVNSKTSKQAEADWMLGIGALNTDGYENVRHFSICKNKLTGDADTEPSLRHDRWDVLIQPEVAQYRDIN